MSDRTVIRIDRTKWGRGETGGSLFCPENGLSCCIGLAAQQLGVPIEALASRSTVDDLITEMAKEQIPAAFIQPNEDYEEYEADHGYSPENDGVYSIEEVYALSRAYGVNDDKDTTDAQKEAELVPLFDEMGFDIEFFN